MPFLLGKDGFFFSEVAMCLNGGFERRQWQLVGRTAFNLGSI